MSSQESLHKAFLNRTRAYEKRYQKQFYRYLASVNYAIAKDIQENGFNVDIDSYLDYQRIENIYKKLYSNVTINEAKIEWNSYDFTQGIKQKDLLDDLLGILAPNENQPITFWRRLLNDFLELRIAGRITQVNTTTRRRIANIVEQGIEEGLGADEVARNIRADRGYNRNRSLAIARTETITAANQGIYLSAMSTPYVMEKYWSPTRDSRTRPSHLDMSDRPAIDLNALFWVANADGDLEQALYPCAETLTASNTVNCRCRMVARAKRDENGRPIRKNRL